MASSVTEEKLLNLSRQPQNFSKHIEYLQQLKKNGFEPTVIYDIGCCVLHWTNMVKNIWPDAQIILFDAFAEAEFLYKDYAYHVGVLGDKDGKVVSFFKNVDFPGGNSYYKEIGHNDSEKIFPEGSSEIRIARTLDTIVAQNNFPLPDFVKIDVQGAERDIFMGGSKTLSNAKHMIVEMQHVEYNKGAPKVDETMPIIKSLGFECTHEKLANNGPDADYAFSKIIN